MSLFAYETLEERNAIINMPAAARMFKLLGQLNGSEDDLDLLAMQAIHAEMAINRLGSRLMETDAAAALECMVCAGKARDAFHIISWNVKHYPFVKEHYEHCIGFGTILRDGRRYELSGSMCCPGNHMDMDERQVRARATKLIEEAGVVLTKHGL